MSNKSGASSDIISLPKGGGALEGIGETFSPDLFTGTGNFSVPISLPSGRNGFQPDIKLVYSTGSGNGPFGLGWGLSVPGIQRKTSKGIPQYQGEDTFVLSGAEDLVLVDEQTDANNKLIQTFRPRTEGLFARIERHRPDSGGDWWEVRTKDGNISYYGTPVSEWAGARDPANIARPGASDKIFNWNLTRTEDPFGNRIEYSYAREESDANSPRSWEQLYLDEIRYVDFDNGGTPDFAARVKFNYADRPDPFSTYRASFEIRTTKRCTSIDVKTHVSGSEPIRSYILDYAPDDALLNGSSLLQKVIVEGNDGTNTQQLPPLEFSYEDFSPQERRFEAVEGTQLPTVSLGHPTLETVDLFGNGLPDLVEMSGSYIRYWRNLGEGKFDLPRMMDEAPGGLSLADPGVQFIDADGNGRADLLVSRPNQAGYFPLRFDGKWDKRSFQPYDVAPSLGFADPNIKLMDLDGDGITDILRSGTTSFKCYYNDEDNTEAWKQTGLNERKHDPKLFPEVNFSDPRVRTADMTGDGLQDIVLVHDGRIDYWPNKGYGKFGSRIFMHNSPRYPWGYNPKHILIGDVDGDGLSDVVFVGNGRVTLWINKGGNEFSDPIVIRGTPTVTDADAVRLIDLKGTGVPGVLWSRDASAPGRHTMHFLDFTGGRKPYLLTEMNNHMGAVTKVEYQPSTNHYVRDHENPETQWKTPLPFPVQTVSKVEVIDKISKGKLTTEYEYHHGYWDGVEREFRGFGRVVQRDTEVFADYNASGLHGGEAFNAVGTEDFSPPLETRHWFHLGPIYDPDLGWKKPDFSDEYWDSADPNSPLRMLSEWDDLDDVLSNQNPPFSNRQKRDAVRTLRGRKLRSELYALDGSTREERPYTVSESLHSVRLEGREFNGGEDALSIFFSFSKASRTTNWDRGDDPATSFEFTDDYDAYGQPQRQTSIACPRGWKNPDTAPGSAYLATHGTSIFINVDEDDQYMVGRTQETEAWEVIDDGSSSLVALKTAIDGGTATTEIQGHSVFYYDGAGTDSNSDGVDDDAFVGLPKGQIGEYGAVVRTEKLVLTGDVIAEAYPSGNIAPDDSGEPVYLIMDSPDSTTPSSWPSEYPADFRTRIEALAGRAGYVYDSNTDRYYVQTGRTKYDFHDVTNDTPRGLPLSQMDPLGSESSIAWDATYELLPKTFTNAVGLTTSADYDWRSFKPIQVTEPNGNRVKVAYTPLGLVSKNAVMNEDGATEALGDTLAAPGTSFDYTFNDYEVTPTPVSVRTTKRIHHVNNDYDPADPDETIESIEFSDGFGRVIQSRAQAEELDFGDAGLPATGAPSNAVGSSSTTRVRVSGWRRYNNKGKVVEKWEPFFSEGWDFDDVSNAPAGQSVELFYDARGRQFKTKQPNGAENLVVFGVPGTISTPDLSTPENYEPTPWERYTYDANDADSELDGNGTRVAVLGSAASHWDTPASAVFDVMGRVISATERNGAASGDWYTTSTKYDIRGNVLEVTDPLGRVAATQVYDLADQTLRTDSIDAGNSIAVFDAAGTPVEARDAKGGLALKTVDDLLRPKKSWGRDKTGDDVRLVEQVIYGDDEADEVAAKAANRLGKPYQHFDEAGRLVFSNYDFKGNLLTKTRCVIKPEHMITAYDAADSSNNYVVDTFRVDWGPVPSDRASTLLDDTDYQTDTAYDGLNRPRQVTYPEDVDLTRKVLMPTYNSAGALQAVDMGGDNYVQHIAYNARGQRILAVLGNGVMTRYAYDPKTFRLTRLRSEDYSYTSNPETYTGSGTKHQDIAYEYDAVGNVTKMKHDGNQVGIGGSNQLERFFEYDALYRLTEAGGREHAANPSEPWEYLPGGGNANDPVQTREYTEKYTYDAVGSLTKLVHNAGGTLQWKRDYVVESTCNQLTSMTSAGTTRSYTYDAAGNLLQENTNRHHEWDWGGRMRAFRDQVPGSPASVFAHYTYDAGGQRVQKVVSKSSGNPVHSVYIDGIFEHHREIDGTGSVAEENNVLHVMDDTKRVATKRLGPELDGSNPPVTQYHLGDHLQSSAVVVDGTGAFYNREEYRPYGESSFGSYAKKRYRFTGKERDEESSLYYHGARYYAPWAARWTAPDPLGMVDGPNLYQYVSGNPVRLVDPTGTQKKSKDSDTNNVMTFGEEEVSGDGGGGDVMTFREDEVTSYEAERDAGVYHHYGPFYYGDIREYIPQEYREYTDFADRATRLGWGLLPFSSNTDIWIASVSLGGDFTAPTPWGVGVTGGGGAALEFVNFTRGPDKNDPMVFFVKYAEAGLSGGAGGSVGATVKFGKGKYYGPSYEITADSYQGAFYGMSGSLEIAAGMGGGGGGSIFWSGDPNPLSIYDKQFRGWLGATVDFAPSAGLELKLSVTGSYSDYSRIFRTSDHIDLPK